MRPIEADTFPPEYPLDGYGNGCFIGLPALQCVVLKEEPSGPRCVVMGEIGRTRKYVLLNLQTQQLLITESPDLYMAAD